MAPNCSEKCKGLGMTYVAGGGCQPEHYHFMFVETGDLDKFMK